ncbi:hypothetical protein Adu01nite_42730 [Paractinoplanes durhamensis]|uniref:Uncharacterized protein n=1 Tax=Paractinoplanes durhamensis TaxID=113563 RepID=A0ABQ3YZB4_9ACTN|nr:hypothetical protein Adu01nite_42730 [Actinoplanes durhamensis]
MAVLREQMEIGLGPGAFRGTPPDRRARGLRRHHTSDIGVYAECKPTNSRLLPPDFPLIWHMQKGPSIEGPF